MCKRIAVYILYLNLRVLREKLAAHHKPKFDLQKSLGSQHQGFFVARVVRCPSTTLILRCLLTSEAAICRPLLVHSLSLPKQYLGCSRLAAGGLQQPLPPQQQQQRQQ